MFNAVVFMATYVFYNSTKLKWNRFLCLLKYYCIIHCLFFKTSCIHQLVIITYWLSNFNRQDFHSDRTLFPQNIVCLLLKKVATSLECVIKMLKPRHFQGIETSLVGATHAQAVSALRNTGEQVTLVVLPAGSIPPVARTAPLYSSKRTPKHNFY